MSHSHSTQISAESLQQGGDAPQLPNWDTSFTPGGDGCQRLHHPTPVFSSMLQQANVGRNTGTSSANQSPTARHEALPQAWWHHGGMVASFHSWEKLRGGVPIPSALTEQWCCVTRSDLPPLLGPPSKADVRRGRELRGKTPAALPTEISSIWNRPGHCPDYGNLEMSNYMESGSSMTVNSKRQSCRAATNIPKASW